MPTKDQQIIVIKVRLYNAYIPKKKKIAVQQYCAETSTLFVTIKVQL